MPKEKLWKTREPLLQTTLKMTRKSGSLTYCSSVEQYVNDKMFQSAVESDVDKFASRDFEVHHMLELKVQN